MIQFAAYPTGRPLFVNPKDIGAIADAIEMTPPALAGGRPGITIVGTTIIVQGVPLQVQGEATENEILVRLSQGKISELEAQKAIATYRAAPVAN